MKYLIFILLSVIVVQGFIIKDLKSKHPAIIVVEQENDFYKSLPTVPKETIKGLK